MRDGTYSITGTGWMDGPDDNEFVQVGLYINGTITSTTKNYSGSGRLGNSSNMIVQLSAADTVQLWIYHSDSVSNNTTTGSGRDATLGVTEIR